MRAAVEHPRVAVLIALVLALIALAGAGIGGALAGQPARGDAAARSVRVADTRIATLEQQVRAAQAQASELRRQLAGPQVQTARVRRRSRWRPAVRPTHDRTRKR